MLEAITMGVLGNACYDLIKHKVSLTKDNIRTSLLEWIALTDSQAEEITTEINALDTKQISNEVELTNLLKKSPKIQELVDIINQSNNTNSTVINHNGDGNIVTQNTIQGDFVIGNKTSSD